MTDPGPTAIRLPDSPRRRRIVFTTVCALVIGLIILGAGPGLSVLKNPHAEDCYYNLLVQGFRAGQLNLKKEVPPGLAQLANPYDPAVNAPYIPDVGDMSFYQGKLYLYFGIVPALTLYWPFLALTGHYLQDTCAGILFCSFGYLVAAALLYAIWRRYFPRVGILPAMSAIFAFGLLIAAQETQWIYCRIYEIALSSGFAFTMLALATIWNALHRGRRRALWLSLASLAYGLAIGSRPSLLFGSIILLIPLVQIWRDEKASRRQTGWLLAAAAGPLVLIGTGLMIYNSLRFGSPLEFGFHYQLTGVQQMTTRQFSLHYLGFNLRFYFFEPIHWMGHLPFVQEAPEWNSTWGRFGAGLYYGGLLTISPIVWLALMALLRRKDSLNARLGWFTAAVFLLFASCAITVCLFFCAYNRYELDFLPALMLLAVIGIFALENGSAGSLFWRGISYWAWRVLIAFSMVTAVLASLDAYATANYFAGNDLLNRGALNQAIKNFHTALTFEPEYAEAHDGLGNALFQKGQPADAIAQFARAIAIKPNLTETHYNLGYCLLSLGRIQDAMAQDQIVLKLDPKFAKAHNGLGSCYLQQGRISDAVAEFEKTVELAPDFPDGHNNLGFCLLQTGHVPEAVVQFQKAVALDPQSANFRCGLGNALLKEGHGSEAVTEYQKAVEIDPTLAGARYDLASALLQIGHINDAIVQYQKAAELRPNSATYHWGLADALSQNGLTNEAAAQYRKAIELNPSLARMEKAERRPPAAP